MMAFHQPKPTREVKNLKYYVPELKELADVFRNALRSNFKIACVLRFLHF
jgi:hypothetical protein